MTDGWRATLIGNAANGRAGTPGDVASLVRFLASPESGHVTGQVIHADGGLYAGL
ncbi:SDR family oxidoreductase [Streptomyces sp. NBC_01803]|uniref:SDR family oxidoreductase n=1 Tax=Streptomyces sp. NBC_01803 TaxID=2975946 RepID=UPI003FA37F54